MNSIKIDRCLKAIDRAKKLRNLNIFLTETFELALNQANTEHNGKAFIFIFRVGQATCAPSVQSCPLKYFT